MSSPYRYTPVTLILLAACSSASTDDGGTFTTFGTFGSQSDATTGDGDGDAGDGDGDSSGDGDGDPGDGDGDGEPSEGCGNGVIDPGEQCDLGEQNSDTGNCTTFCNIATCGDGLVLEGLEECDDGNAVNSDECVEDCKVASCGDGHVQDGVEECDDGNLEDGDECLSDCTLSLLPMVGDACDVNFLFQCVPALDGNAGTPLLCEDGVLTETSLFQGACNGLCPQGSNISVEACGGWGEYAICLCELNEPCEGTQLGCQGELLTLCHEGEAVIGECPGCAMMDGYYTCDW
jgi:cysteine-rich repeat protein